LESFVRLTLNIVLLVIILTPFCWGQKSDTLKAPVDFFKEQITLKIDDSTCYISGVYYFRNNRDYTGTFPVAFPFYIDSLTLYPDTMAAYFIDNLDTLPISTRRNIKGGLAVLNIPVKSREITCWHLDYKQRIKSSRAVYIITSTASWGKPLEDATYEFIVPANYKNIVTWPEPDTIINQDSYFEYISHKTDFMPRHDMEIKWDPAK
jgi:hypothetical protein